MKIDTRLLLGFVLLATFGVARAQDLQDFALETNADNTLTIIGYLGNGGDVAIPAIIDGLAVTDIGTNAFYGELSLTSVIIPTNVVNIEDSAFDQCSNLTEVTIGSDVTSLGEEAFGYCVSLTNVTIPASVTSLGDRAFKTCTHVTVFHFEGNAPSIGDEVFEKDTAAICYLSGATGWSSTFGGLAASPCGSATQTGSLEVSISPPGAISAGAKWQVDGGTNEVSGAIVSDLPVGTHTVSFTFIPGSGWLTPSNQSVTITKGATTKASGDYLTSAQAQVQWAKRIASTATDLSGGSMNGLILDNHGNCYLTGAFNGANNFGGITLTNQSLGGSDIFVAEYNSNGLLQWAQRAGDSSTNSDFGDGIGVDSAGNVYVTGGFYGPAGFGSFNLPATQSEEFFLAKYDSAGMVQWVKQSSGDNTGNIYGTGLAVDGAGNCYAVVYGGGGGATITFGATNLSMPFDYDESIFLVKYDNSGALAWAQLIGGSGETYSTKVTLDASGNVYLCGSFESAITIGSSNLAGPSLGANMFVAKFNSSGGLTWVKQTTGNNAGSGGVAVDQTGNVYVANSFEGAISFGGPSLTNAGNDAFVAKYNSSGVIQWARQAAGEEYNGFLDVALDGQGNVYPAGFLSAEAAVAKYDQTGNLQWVFSATGPAASPVSSAVAKCAVDSAGNCYLAGEYQGTATFGTTVLQPQETWNFFLAKVTPPVPPTITGEPISQTNMAGSNVTLQVAATGAGTLTYEWFFDGGKVSGATTDVLTLKSVTAANTGSYEVIVTNISGSVTSTVVTVKVLVPGNPKLTITSPASGQSVIGSNYDFSVIGTTTDKALVTNVSYRFNGGSWMSATPGNSWSNWTASVILVPGSNTISAYAQDITGINSPAITNKFKFFPSGILMVKTNGLGSITPVDNGKSLGLGTNYTLTASPGKNWIFSNWVASGSGSFASNNPVLTFNMQSNLVLTANFVTNPFIAIQGAYNGLFYQTNANSPVTEQSSGFASITISPGSKGAYSAVLKVDGGTYSFSSSFDLNGNSVTNITRKGKSSLALTLHIDLNLSPPEDYMTGSVEAGNWDGPSGLLADLAYFNGATLKASNYAGKYTFVLPGSGTPATSPGGDSVAEFTNNLAGNAVLTGSLADNTTISSLSTPISKEGFVPVYYSYTPGTNVIFGWLNFTNVPPQTVAGDLTWFKLPIKSKALYSNGFTLQSNILGSLYAPVTTNTLVKDGTLTIVDLAQNINLVYTNVSIISNKLSYANTTTNQLSATITPTTGVISWSFRPTGVKTNLTAQGVVLQNSPADPLLKAAGWFMGSNQTGYFRLTQ